MPSHKRRTAGPTRKPKADDHVRDTLRAVRRALLLQTARVAELQARLHDLTDGREPASPAPRRDPLTDTEIYWRRHR
jgi:hypothetical protein